jgi:hypothetical protein
VYGTSPNTATLAAIYRFLLLCEGNSPPVGISVTDGALRYARAAKPAPELMARVTTGPMPCS